MDINKIIEGLGEKKEEIIRKAALCKNAEELLALANGCNVEIDESDAAELFASMQAKPRKLSDDELDAVAGGGPKGKVYCLDCGTTNWNYPFREYDDDNKFIREIDNPCQKCGGTNYRKHSLP